MTGAFAEVLARYPQPIRTADWSRLESSGGLSGAEIWRGDRDGQPFFYSKGYPPGVDPLDLSLRHKWCALASDAGLKFVPRIIANTDGRTFAICEARAWEIGSWMPGEADFADRPSRAKLISACDAVMSLLECWRGVIVRSEVPPAVRNRLALFKEWERDPVLSSPAISPDLERRARTAIAARLPDARAALQPWAGRALPCRLCVRDLRHDHFLFTDETLTGLIDYGAVAWDTPATDAARMLGELAGGDAALYELGLQHFADRLGHEVCPPELVRALDSSGVVGSIIRWLLRLRRSGVAPAPVREIELRLTRLIERLERGAFPRLGC